MKTLTIGILVLTLSSASFAAESVVGIFAPQKLGSRLELSATGDFSLESVSDVKIWFAGGHWKKKGKVVTLSWGEEIARYSIEDDGQRLTLIRKLKAASSVEHPDVALATEYKKEPIQASEPTAASGRGSP